MSVAARSPVEEALETQPFGALQLRVVLLCALVQAFDGFDLGTIGMAAPSLSKAWGVAPPLFTTSFVMSSVGILVGALLSPMGDRFGRKPLLIISVAFIGIFSVASAFTWSIPSITVMRFMTGLGIGVAMPVTVALTSDYSPIQRRGTLIMLMFSGNMLGGFLGGQLVARILPIFGWQSIFLAGGIPPLLLIPFLVMFLLGVAALPDRPPRRCAGDAGYPAPPQCPPADGGLEDGGRGQGQSGRAAFRGRACDINGPALDRLLRQSPEHVSFQLLDDHGSHALRLAARNGRVLFQHVPAWRDFEHASARPHD
jgi:MFS family permease